MSRYYFDIRDGEDFTEDDEGIELQGDLVTLPASFIQS